MYLPSAHSPLGASSAYRWMACPGSYVLSKGHGSEESDYAAVGTVAHELASTCLITNDYDAWMHIGTAPHPEYDIICDADMAEAVQTYVDYVEKFRHDYCYDYIEYSFHANYIHPLMYGTCDFALVDPYDQTIRIVDYKHGVGIPVSVVDNPQLMYYATGMLSELELWDDDDVNDVQLTIVQPRAYHPDGVIRSVCITKQKLQAWANEKLIPAMKATDLSREEALANTVVGEHCRFCPVLKADCPAVKNNWLEMEKLLSRIEREGADELSADDISLFLNLFENAKISAKEIGKVALARMMRDQKIPGWKMVNGQTKRHWKEGAEAAVVAEFGMDAIVPAKTKSPAEIDKMPGGKSFTSRWAAKPPAGKTIAKESDPRRELNSQSKANLFKKV